MIAKSKKIAVIISYINFFVSLLTTVFFTPLLLKAVGDDYGVFAYSESIITWLTLISSTLASAFIRFATVEATKNNNGESKDTNSLFIVLLSIISFISLIIGFLILILFKTNVIHLSKFDGSQTQLFYSIFFISVINCGLEIVVSFFSIYVLFKKYYVVVRAATLVSTLLYPILSLFALKMGGGMLIVAIILFGTRLLGNVFLLFFSFVKLRIKFSFFSFKKSAPLLREIALFCSIILINTFVDTFNSSVDKILLGSLKGAAFVTIYQLGATFVVNLNSVTLAMVNNYIPSIHEYAQKNNLYEINSLYCRISSILSFILLMIVGGFASCGLNFIELWIGPGRLSVYYIALILMFSGSYTMSNSITIEYQRSLKKHGFRALIYLLSLILNFALTLLLLLYTSVDPFVSCVFATVLSELIFKWIIMSIYNKRVMKLDVGKIFFRYISFLLIAFTGYVFVRGLSTFLSFSVLINMLIEGFVFVLIYCTGCAIFVKISDEELWRIIVGCFRKK